MNKTETKVLLKVAKKEKKKRDRERLVNDIVASKRNLDKRSKKKVNQMAGRDSWVDAHHKEEYAYALGLFDPSSKICTRIPTPLPIATAVLSHRGTLTLNASATGYLNMYLDPWSTLLIASNNAATITDLTTLSFLTGSVSNLMTASLATRCRVVSASLDVTDLTPALTRTGIFSVGSIPISQLINGTPTSDVVRDSLWVETVNSQSIQNYLSGVYIPMDYTAAAFFAPGSRPASDYEVPVVMISAAAANASINIKYCINYEYIPTGSQTDVIPTQLSPVGILDNGLAHVGDIKRVIHQKGSSYLGAIANNFATQIPNFVLGGAKKGLAAIMKGLDIGSFNEKIYV